MPTRYAQKVTFFAATGSLCYGYASSIIAYIIGFQSFFDYMGLVSNSAHSNSIIGAANGLYPGGGCFGCLFVAWVGEVYGRKRSMQIGCVIGIIGAILMCAAQNIPMFLVSRFVMGWSIGMLVTLVPLYQSECSPPSHRGLMVGYHGILIAASYTLAGLVSYACYYAPYGQFQWRFPLAVQLVPVTTLLIGSFFLPRSPRWLLSKGLEDEAWQVSQDLFSDPNDPDLAAREFDEMKSQIELERKNGAVTPWGKARLAFSRASYRKRLGLGFLLQAGNQSVGNIVINNYQVTLYGSLGITGGLPILLTAMWNFVAIGGNATSALFIDRVGRRRFLMVGIAGCLVFLGLEMAMVAEFVGTTNKAGNAAGVFALFGYIVFYSGGCDSVQYVYASEIFPMQWRSFGMGFSLFGQWIANTVYLAVTPTALAAASWKFFFLFIALGIVYFVLVYFFMPETSGLSLEQVGAVFGDEHVEDHHVGRSKAITGQHGLEAGSRNADSNQDLPMKETVAHID